MKTLFIKPSAIMLLIIGALTVTNAQGNRADVYWHLDPSVKTCSMVIDPSLTQAQWKTFVKQVGPIASYKTLASAEPLGTLNYYVALDQGNTPVDQRNLAWINTFTHPDEDCPLGDAISFPELRARVGISDNMDIGAYWTTAPGANYGMVGAELKYRFSRETEFSPAVSARGSATFLTGVSDFDLNIYGAELIASKKISYFSPYVGLRGNLAVGTETTPKVNLSTERVFIVQGFAGVSCSVWIFNLAAEYNVSNVNTLAVAVGVNF